MPWEAIGQLGASALGQHMANKAQVKQAKRAEAFSAAEAKKNRQFQKEMSNTAHQRQVKDLKAAGLNPILSAGAGASSPGGAQGSAQMANQESITKAVGEAASTAIESKRLKKEIAAVESQTDLNTKLGEKANADKETQIATAKQMEATLPAVKAESTARAIQGYYDAENAKLDAILKRAATGSEIIGNTLGGIGKGAGSFIKSLKGSPKKRPIGLK